MREIVVISGKGGTGKTSITASFAALADQPVLADCDVDAADLHLVLEPDVRKTEDFSGGKQAVVDASMCIGCGTCEAVCRFGALVMKSDTSEGLRITYQVDPVACEGCGVCAWFCGEAAIEMRDVVNGQVFESETRLGPMVHARLGVAEENSGKLVSTVRDKARHIAEERGLDLILVDGAPGVGCPVIASITGATAAVIVTEPTLSGLHDLARVVELAGHFKLPCLVCINKWDINPDMALRIENYCQDNGLAIVGRVGYSDEVTRAMVARQTVVEYNQSTVSDEIRNVWANIMEWFDRAHAQPSVPGAGKKQ